MGLANCAAGNFNNFIWNFSYAGVVGSNQNCQLTTPHDAVVTATDQSNNQVASQKISMNWGPNCAILCGNIGQPACPAGCLSGVNSHPGFPDGQCVACGGEGAPPCPGNVCQQGMHLNGIDSPVCTATCGNNHQSPCLTDGSSLGVTNIFHCYSGTTIEASGSCVCVLDPEANPCQEINSGGSGLCTRSVFIPQGCR
jgi:hypothetical protein